MWQTLGCLLRGGGLSCRPSPSPSKMLVKSKRQSLSSRCCWSGGADVVRWRWPPPCNQQPPHQRQASFIAHRYYHEQAAVYRQSAVALHKTVQHDLLVFMLLLASRTCQNVVLEPARDLMGRGKEFLTMVPSEPLVLGWASARRGSSQDSMEKCAQALRCRSARDVLCTRSSCTSSLPGRSTTRRFLCPAARVCVEGLYPRYDRMLVLVSY